MYDLQQHVDNYYLNVMGKKPCCAGCNWWRFYNSTIGDCTKSAPVSSDDRIGMLGIDGCSMQINSGHIMTKRDHSCGDFIDTHDWST